MAASAQDLAAGPEIGMIGQKKGASGEIRLLEAPRGFGETGCGESTTWRWQKTF